MTTTSTRLKKLLNLTWPIMLAQIVSQSAIFVGMIFIAKLGKDALAASALLYAVQLVLLTLFMSPLFAVSAIASQEYGRGERSMLGNLMQQSWFLSLLLSLPVMLIFLFIKPILLMFGQKLVLINLIAPYFVYAAFTVLPIFINTVNSQFGYAIQRLGFVIFTTVILLVVNLTLGYGLVLGAFGLPKLGITGFGIASLIANWLQLGIYIFLFKFFKGFKPYELFKRHAYAGLQLMKKTFAIGWPIAVQMGGELVSFFMITLMVGWLSTTQLAAQQIIVQYLMILLMPVYALSQASNIFVAQAVGEKDVVAVKSYGDLSLWIGLVFIVLITIVMSVFPLFFSSLYVKPGQPHAHIILMIMPMLIFVSLIGQVFDTMRNVLTGALRGLLDTKYPMVIGIISIWVLRVPLSYFFGFTLHGGVVGVAWGAVVGMIFGAGMLLWRWHAKAKAQLTA
tara:strand:+ start:143 stop:1495 length:1353 start_codon:yes stop_codon:yes gene_type:complete